MWQHKTLIDKNTACHSFELPSKENVIDKFLAFVEELSILKVFNEQKRLAIETCLCEAINNARTHGNACVSKSIVKVDIRIDSQTLSVMVKDGGSGFKQSPLKDPQDEENLLREGGRGILLMRALSDSMTYSSPGNEILLIFNIT